MRKPVKCVFVVWALAACSTIDSKDVGVSSQSVSLKGFRGNKDALRVEAKRIAVECGVAEALKSIMQDKTADQIVGEIYGWLPDLRPSFLGRLRPEKKLRPDCPSFDGRVPEIKSPAQRYEFVVREPSEVIPSVVDGASRHALTAEGTQILKNAAQEKNARLLESIEAGQSVLWVDSFRQKNRSGDYTMSIVVYDVESWSPPDNFVENIGAKIVERLERAQILKGSMIHAESDPRRQQPRGTSNKTVDAGGVLCRGKDRVFWGVPSYTTDYVCGCVVDSDPNTWCKDPRGMSNDEMQTLIKSAWQHVDGVTASILGFVEYKNAESPVNAVDIRETDFVQARPPAPCWCMNTPQPNRSGGAQPGPPRSDRPRGGSGC